MKNAIEIKNLVKKYDNNFKLGEINLEIPSGCIIGLIGENGAGKTTLIKSILNIINPEKSEIKIFNKDNKEYEKDIKEEIGVVLDNMFFPEILTAKDIGSIMKDIYKKWDQQLFDRYIIDFNIPKNKKINTLSKGMRTKLLILDEPTSGLDPVVRTEILDIFLKFIEDDEHTILFSTHITSDLEHIADHIIFIDKGNILLNKTRDEILDNYGILKCDIDSFNKIDKNDIVSYKKNKYDYQILVNNKDKIHKKYKDFILDKITLDDLMVLMIKGERIC